MPAFSILLPNPPVAGRAGAHSGGAALSGGDPFAAGREVAWSGPDALAAGQVAVSGVGECEDFPHTEILVVTGGRLILSSAEGGRRELSPGQGVVIARGTALRFEAAPGTRWAFCAGTGLASAAPGLTELPEDAVLSPSSPPPIELLEGPAPQCRSFNAFTDEAMRLRAGIWDSTPYRRVSRPHRVNELMHVLAGSVTLTGADGRPVRIGAGETVFVPHGVPCAWTNDEHVAKIYVVQEVAA
ncbi:cupin domain-containing protein [Bosea sp. CS1GBMeth4]|uniref:cupin domain-containing protein n=1 Tax=Bosea sp. CS1GBMeth4 TaxID=1892849 RepID=UPI0016452E36|nr:cupin domain-containing protein [Bosea sp. CS1GBMeth4]